MTAEELIIYENLITELANESESTEIESEMALAAIHNYLNHPTNTKIDTATEYKFAIVMLLKEFNEANTIKAKFGGMGVTSMTQGSRSISYKDSASGGFIISDTLRGLLPVPFVSLF